MSGGLVNSLSALAICKILKRLTDISDESNANWSGGPGYLSKQLFLSIQKSVSFLVFSIHALDYLVDHNIHFLNVFGSTSLKLKPPTNFYRDSENKWTCGPFRILVIADWRNWYSSPLDRSPHSTRKTTETLWTQPAADSNYKNIIRNPKSWSPFWKMNHEYAKKLIINCNIPNNFEKV